MKTLLVPQFNSEIQFTGYKEVKIKNKPDTKDYNKVCNALPGLPQGYGSEIYTIGQTGMPIELTSFYDIRQRGINKIKNFFITLKNK